MAIGKLYWTGVGSARAGMAPGADKARNYSGSVKRKGITTYVYVAVLVRFPASGRTGPSSGPFRQGGARSGAGG